MTAYTSTFSTSFGPFSIAVSENGSVLATAFGKLDSLRERFTAENLIDDSKRTRQAREQISAYLAGKRTGFDLPLAPEGTAFQKRVWTALQKIPRGEIRSYGNIAKSLRTAPRAVGRANATNPICLIVPCHRVIGADGSLAGFAFGEDIKKRLLEHEGVSL
ncbi:MAG: methylated-DNA--[protein]-cysteine S-methyltransferase [Nibricoccus sp.]